MKGLAFTIAMLPVMLLLIAGVLTGVGWVFLAAFIACGLPILVMWRGTNPYE